MRIDADGEGLAFDLATAAVSGAVTFDGQALGHLSCNGSYVRFTHLATQQDYRFPIHCTQTEGWRISGSLPPATYRAEVYTSYVTGPSGSEHFPEGFSLAAPA